jgi:pyrimidine deaminase RibD-like protein
MGNEVIGKGWHKYFGGKHAEINALDEAGKTQMVRGFLRCILRI